MTPKRSLTAQVDEVSRLLAERSSSRKSAADEYRIETLRAVLTTLHWLEANAEVVKRAAQGSSYPGRIGPHSKT